MPIEIRADLRRPTEDEFASLAYDVMACAFQVHNEIGRFFDEKIYKRAIARRLGGVELEVPVIVTHDGFGKRYALDMLVRSAALFEWKAVNALADEHRGQLMHYLMLCDLPRGKLVNVRPELVEHEFINMKLQSEDRFRFTVDDAEYQPLDATDHVWKDFLLEAVKDWGAGLDVHLYEAASAYALGGEDNVIRDIEITIDGQLIGRQKARVTRSNAALKVTTLSDHEAAFETHARRYLAHTTLKAVHWVNINRKQVLFKTLLPEPEPQESELAMH